MTEQSEFVPERPHRYRPSRAQWTLAGVILAFVVGVVLVKVVKGVGLGQTAAFYIGIPTVLALILTLSAPSGKAMGMTLKAITILLLLAMPVLGEGFVCVIIAAPLFYFVAIVVVWLVGMVRRDMEPPGGARVVVLPAVLLFGVLASAEGTTSFLTFSGDSTVAATRTVTGTPDDVLAALARPLRFDEVAPSGVLAAGFPRPMTDHGGGLDVGDRRLVMFDGAHHRPALVAAHHWGEKPSQVEFEVAQRGPNSVTLRTVADDTPLATWLTWQAAEVSWRAVDAQHVEVTWTLRYTRKLAPAWYFGPIERFVTERAAGYLLDTLDIRA